MQVQDYLEQVKYVLFDMDGTLLDTNQMKVTAMAHALDDMPECGEFLHHFSCNFGWSREKHFAHLSKFFLNDDESLKKEYRKRYENNLEKNLSNIKFCEGAKELVELLAERGTGMSVVTGSDQNDAKRVLKLKGISQYMDEILGSPNMKATSVKKIIQKFGCRSKESLLIGDSMNDLEAAEVNNMPFLYTAKYTLKDQDKIRQRVMQGNHWEVHSLQAFQMSAV